MKCGACGSEETKRLEVIYEQGTSDISTGTVMVGTRGEAFASTKGTSQTLLSKKAAPPIKKGVFLKIIGMLICFSFSDSLFFETPVPRSVSTYGWGALWLLLTLVLLSDTIKAFKFNKKQWPLLYQSWQKSWYCFKCGNIYLT